MRSHILVVDDDPGVRATLARALEQAGHKCDGAGSIAEARAALDRARYDVVVLDLMLGDGSGIDLLRGLRSDCPECRAIVVTGHGSVDAAVEAMKLGASDFVRKPLDLTELLVTIDQARRTDALERRVAYHEGRERARQDEAPLVCRSPAMVQLNREVAQLAAQPVPVILVVGESGAGKELVARRLHSASSRQTGPFVELNAATIPATLVESELFGHERGAFSDARERKPGLVEIAHGGTLFLDEIGELEPQVQSKLLSFLETFSFRRVGGTASRAADIRLVAATNRDLGAAVKEGRFRADLYYRLNPLTLTVPPLRDRPEDVLPLADHFRAEWSRLYGKHFTGISDDAARVLTAWRWPGNVRELRGVIQRVVLMSSGETILPEHLPVEMTLGAIDPVPGLLAGASGPVPTLDEVMHRYMRAVVAMTGGNKLRAAERLGITRQTLARHLDDPD